MCSWKYYRKHIFYLLLTFSQLPNKYIISFLSPQTQKKQNPKKKIHQIRSKNSSNPVRSLLDRRSTIGAMLWSTKPVRSTQYCNPWDRWDRCHLVWSARPLLVVSLSLSLSLSLSARLSPKIVWSENRNVKWFPGQSLYFYSQMKCISGNSIFHAQPNTRFYGKWFPEMVWSQNKRTLNEISFLSNPFPSIVVCVCLLLLCWNLWWCICWSRSKLVSHGMIWF